MIKRTLTVTGLALACHTALAAPELQTGYFIDAPVTGLYYKTSSNYQGFTEKGAFKYNTGDVITFFIGNDDTSFPLATLSGQEVITPTLAATTPSRSVNMTRLLLSLDSTPENREEIHLVSKALSDPDFQQRLKQINLQALDTSREVLGLELVSVKEAAQHLNESQSYIEENFTSKDVILHPMNVKYKNIIIKRRDWQGNLCFFDVARKATPEYFGPIGSMTYMITPKGIYEYPDVGDYFGSTDNSVPSCELNYSRRYKEIMFEPISVFEGWDGLIGCAANGCTRSDLNGFSIDDYDDEGDWKYRTVAINYDPHTRLLMQKNQGLGPKDTVPHTNQAEYIWFTYDNKSNQSIDFEGIWLETHYSNNSDVSNQCLWIMPDAIFSAEASGTECPTSQSAYRDNVTRQHADMWWLAPNNTKASLAQLNAPVKWYDEASTPRYTSWEYLPSGPNWDQGVLYRLQQHIVIDKEGKQQAQTHQITELKKYHHQES
ncbi:chromosome partitioning protein ParA [Photobacterium proteolyticum]|uniref:Chromosome partitioning protein ParA n=1 Tax=Photobacterium proteolyticum TaxID=1903952 RepID=A0A1Q9GIT3_9GAMM|nr:chromosome partitioning protein ParA [Photobacterium proteolyticum]OLQ74372.1 chromosome partitioning protein ParA [Photobacterium proteolyticum]